MRVPQAEIRADQEGVADKGIAMQGADVKREFKASFKETEAMEVALEDRAN